MHLVEDHPLDLADDLAPSVEHVAQDLSRHHQARGVHVDIAVARHQPDLLVTKLRRELPVLLIRQRLDRRCVDHPLAPRERHCDGVLRHDRLTRRGVRRDHHRVATLDGTHRNFLELVELKWKLDCIELRGQRQPGPWRSARRKHDLVGAVVLRALTLLLQHGLFSRPLLRAYHGEHPRRLVCVGHHASPPHALISAHQFAEKVILRASMFL